MTASTKELIERIRMREDSGEDLLDEAADALEIMKSELDSAADSALRHATKYDSLVQAITDQENQPSQYGTVTLAYHNAEVSRLTAELAEAKALAEIACRDSNIKALELEKLRSQEPVAYCDKDGQLWREQNDPDDKPLYARPVPAAQAVPDGWQMVPKEPTSEMWEAVNKLDDEMAAGGYDGKGCTIEQAWDCMLAAAPTYKGEQK